METNAHSLKNASAKGYAEKKSSFFERIVSFGETNRFGVISMLLIFVGCLGGITVGLGGIQHDIALMGIIVTTMTTLSLILAVQPMKYILYAGIGSVIIDLFLLITFVL